MAKSSFSKSFIYELRLIANFSSSLKFGSSFETREVLKRKVTPKKSLQVGLEGRVVQCFLIQFWRPRSQTV